MDLINSVFNDKEAQFQSPDLNVEYRMPVTEYKKLCDYATELHENWGPPPGNLNTDGQNMLVYGKKFGNVFIGVQPTFGYEGDPMRLLFSKSASPHHGFAAYYTYIEKIFKAPMPSYTLVPTALWSLCRGNKSVCLASATRTC